MTEEHEKALTKAAKRLTSFIWNDGDGLVKSFDSVAAVEAVVSSLRASGYVMVKLDEEVIARAIARTHSSAIPESPEAGWTEYLPDARSVIKALEGKE